MHEPPPSTAPDGDTKTRSTTGPLSCSPTPPDARRDPLTGPAPRLTANRLLRISDQQFHRSGKTTFAGRHNDNISAHWAIQVEAATGVTNGARLHQFGLG